MIKTLPLLYSRVGFLIDHPPKLHWMDGTKPYNLKSLTSELNDLSHLDLFDKLIEILIAGRVNLDYFGQLIGEFEEIGNSILMCNQPSNKALIQCTIHYEYLKKQDYKLAKSFHFHFGDKVIFDKSQEKTSLTQIEYDVYPNLHIDVSYPIFSEENLKYSNQLLIQYS